MTKCHPIEFRSTLIGQLDVLNSPIMLGSISRDETGFLETVDDAGNVAVGNHQLPGQLRHCQRIVRPFELGQNVKLRQCDGKTVSKQGSKLLLDDGFTRQQAQPGPYGLLAAPARSSG